MNLEAELPLDRCPHCNIARPHLFRIWGPSTTKSFNDRNKRSWATYQCQTCGGVVLAYSHQDPTHPVAETWPSSQNIDEAVPSRAKEFLEQAIASINAPAGAVMLTASAVDAMLKEKGYKEGSLYSRIDTAAKDNIITKEMALWAHEIRLDANDQRHADQLAPLPNTADAKKVIEFAGALAQFLFILPARVQKGRNQPTQTKE